MDNSSGPIGVEMRTHHVLNATTSSSYIDTISNGSSMALKNSDGSSSSSSESEPEPEAGSIAPLKNPTSNVSTASSVPSMQNFNSDARATMKGMGDLFKDVNAEDTSTSLQNDPNYRIDKHRYYGLFRAFVRQDWSTHCAEHGLSELRAEWTELFFDLIFVACIVRISYQASHSIPVDGDYHRRRLAGDYDTDTDSHSDYSSCHDGDYDYVLTSLAQFGLLSLFWMEQTMLRTHFVLNQFMDDFLGVLYMMAILGAGLFVYNDPDFHFAFLMSYIGVRTVSTLYYFKTMLIPRARAHSLWHITINAIMIVAVAIILVLFHDGCALDYFWIYFGLFLFEYVLSVLEWCIKKEKEVQDPRASRTAIKMGVKLKQKGEESRLIFALPLHVPHVAERFGLFVMIILGETIISVMTVDYKMEATYVSTILFVFANFLFCWMIGRLYYDCQPPEEEIMHENDKHALKLDPMKKHNIPIRILFLGAHHVLFIALLGYGIGVKVAVAHFSEDHNLGFFVRLPCWSLTVIIICLNIIRLTHPIHKPSVMIWILRFVIVVVMGIVPIFAEMVHYQWPLWGTEFLCLLCLLILDKEGNANREEVKNKMREERLEQKEKDKHMGSKNIRSLKTDDLGLDSLREELEEESPELMS